MDFPNSTIIQNHGCEIYFIRHGQSVANVGPDDLYDSRLTSIGICQAQEVSGHFDLVLCSPLRRTMETLHYSKITYKELIVEHSLREIAQSIGSLLLFEKRHEPFQEESLDNFWKRSQQFHNILENHCEKLKSAGGSKKILIVGHAFFFNAWFRKGCFPCLENAKLIRIK